MKFGKVTIRGVEAYVTDLRIGRHVGKKREDLYHYQIRHDDDWCEPCTIEPSVLVNHYGDIVSKEKLDNIMDKSTNWKRISLTEKEVEDIYRALSSATINYEEI